jgi:hypothetical protein
MSGANYFLFEVSFRKFIYLLVPYKPSLLLGPYLKVAFPLVLACSGHLF